jgi:predicted nuclease of predicted toxin-antitoxin system
MIVWLDAQLPFALARWMNDVAGVQVQRVRAMQPRPAKDLDIFLAARKPDNVIISKDHDFAALLARYGSPPQVVQLKCGNLTKRPLIAYFELYWPIAARALGAGDQLVVM